MTDSNTSFTGEGLIASLEMVRNFMSVSSAIVAVGRQSKLRSVSQPAKNSEVAIDEGRGESGGER